MSDGGMKGRVKGLLGTPPEAGPLTEPAAAPEALTEATAQYQALHVLTLAQRTAEDHLNSARSEADRICEGARDTAAQIVQDAQGRAEALQRDAETTLAEARTAAAQTARDAQAHADQARQDADEILSEARFRADGFTKNAQAEADELQHLAQQRYEDVVGSLAARREALQQQIEALEQFDRDYRARLQSFMQSQLRALWVDQPRVDAGGLEPPISAPPTSAPPIHFGPMPPGGSDPFAEPAPDA